MIYFLQGFGVFLGMLAGTGVTILVKTYFAKRAETQQTQNLRFELELNVVKIDKWLKDLTEYRNAVNGDSLHRWFGYFDFGKTIFVTANAMFSSGLLYKALGKDDIASLQALFHDLSIEGERYMNDKLTQHKQLLVSCRDRKDMNDWLHTHKPLAVGEADFWEKDLRKHRKTLQDIIGRITQESSLKSPLVGKLLGR